MLADYYKSSTLISTLDVTLQVSEFVCFSQLSAPTGAVNGPDSPTAAVPTQRVNVRWRSYLAQTYTVSATDPPLAFRALYSSCSGLLEELVKR